MNHQEYEKMKNLEETYWWHVGRRFIITSVLKKYFRSPQENSLILDIGCGTGGNYEILKNFGKVSGVDDSEEALKFARESGYSELVRGSGINLPFSDNKFDCVAMLDVLEHIEDDKLALRECHRILKPDGGFILTVPSYQWLWSGHDEALGHKRRYVKSDLVRKFKNSGFKILFSSYAITFLFPPIAFYRLLDWLRGRRQETSYVMVHPLINKFFTWLLYVEGFLFKVGMRFPFGTSIIIYAQKSK